MAPIVCPGFRLAGVSAGLKKEGKKDLGLIVADRPAAAAGVFTRNRVQAAPVRLTRERIEAGRCQAVIVNSKNANCCTGSQGMADAGAMAEAAARQLGISPDLVAVASTGVIGQPLPLVKIESAIPALAAALSEEAVQDLAQAIMTTDTVPKVAHRTVQIEDKSFTVVGVAKGAGMIRPDMATLLAFLWTDAEAQPGTLSSILRPAVDATFNRITIDGDTSTNDTVLLLAGGRSNLSADAPPVKAALQSAVNEVLAELARALVKDGEGATKLVEIRVRGAAGDADARQIADTVANSNLVKTAFFGEDANWGRVLAAAGRAGVVFDPERVDLFFDDVQMVKDGRGCGKQAEAEATKVLKRSEFAVTLDLHEGEGRAQVLTCDFSVDYVRINADYRS
ncbi:MAG: bifunctional glutamate N-acetyltransferase/amino-acid acetyltransferase ArgJ [Desulfobacterales bacterium]|nr:bifunctional glutamate N-acetyltransferase/amino-acid acetyltransferase ArgJ [Desulfobacterales bacterium]